MGHRDPSMVAKTYQHLAQSGDYLSHYFKRHRAEYYDRLQAVRDRGEWEEWLVFFLKGVADVSREATITARNILALRESHRTAITDRFGRAAANGHRILEHLYESPIVTVNQVQSLTGTTYPAANQPSSLSSSPRAS